jgi:HAE1 family hydrophobic/amphiphilic exporter-1
MARIRVGFVGLLQQHPESGHRDPARPGAHLRGFRGANPGSASDAYSQNYLYLIKKSDDQYQVILEIQDESRSKPEDLALLYIKSDDGKNLVPLSVLVTWKHTLGPQTVNHLNQFTSVTISFNLKPGVPIGDATEHIKKVAEEVRAANRTRIAAGRGVDLPRDHQQPDDADVHGRVRDVRDSRDPLRELLHPLTVLSTLPTALVGGC